MYYYTKPSLPVTLIWSSSTGLEPRSKPLFVRRHFFVCVPVPVAVLYFSVPVLPMRYSMTMSFQCSCCHRGLIRQACACIIRPIKSQVANHQPQTGGSPITSHQTGTCAVLSLHAETYWRVPAGQLSAKQQPHTRQPDSRTDPGGCRCRMGSTISLPRAYEGREADLSRFMVCSCESPD